MTEPRTSTDGNGCGSGTPEATLISVILDRSGSMSSVCEPTIKGFNEFVETQRKQHDGGGALMSLTQFDHQYEVNFVGEPIENVPDLDTQAYIPRGTTALFDAIGRTIHEIDAWVGTHRWQERVLVLIVTDGQENASKEYTFEAIRGLIEQKEKAGWNFAYMGANQDSYAVAGSLNIRQDFTGNYAATAAGTASSFQRMASSTARYRTSNAKGMSSPSFFDPPADQVDPDTTAGKLLPRDANGAANGATKSTPQAGGVLRLKDWISGKRNK